MVVVVTTVVMVRGHTMVRMVVTVDGFGGSGGLWVIRW